MGFENGVQNNPYGIGMQLITIQWRDWKQEGTNVKIFSTHTRNQVQ